MSSVKNFVIRGGALERYVGIGGDVVIPDGVTRILPEAFRGCVTVTSVNIPDTVTKIGRNAFEACLSLVSVVLPKGITVIADNMFRDCYRLACVSIPDKVTMIGDRAFSQCNSLASITIPESVVQLGSWAFEGCGALRTVNFSQGLRYIGFMAFAGCVNLIQADLPSGLQVIGASAFEGCTNLRSVVICSTVTKIEDSAFRRCTGLSCVTFYGGKAEISRNAFEYCSLLWDIAFCLDDTSRLGDYISALMSSKRTVECLASVLRCCPDYIMARANDRLVIKNNADRVFEIASHRNDAAMLENLFAITGTVNLTTLDKYIEQARDNVVILAFLLEYKNRTYTVEQQDEHERLAVEKALGLVPMTQEDLQDRFELVSYSKGFEIRKYLGDDAILYVPEKIENKKVFRIAEYAFGDCEHITTIILPEKLDHIKRHAFYNCKNLECVVIPSAKTNVDWDAFHRCPQLTIHAPAGSKAQAYAQRHHNAFRAL